MPLIKVKKLLPKTTAVLENREYWCYGIVPSAIVDFFSFFKGAKYMLLQHNFGDLYLRHYLHKNSKYNIWTS